MRMTVKRQLIGVNKLGLIMKRMTTSAGIVGEKKLTMLANNWFKN